MNIPTACSDSTSQKVQISLFCPIPMSKGSRINSTHAPERYSATEPLVRFSSTPTICPLHFTVEWASAIISIDGPSSLDAAHLSHTRAEGPEQLHHQRTNVCSSSTSRAP